MSTMSWLEGDEAKQEKHTESKPLSQATRRKIKSNRNKTTLNAEQQRKQKTLRRDRDMEDGLQQVPSSSLLQRVPPLPSRPPPLHLPLLHLLLRPPLLSWEQVRTLSSQPPPPLPLGDSQGPLLPPLWVNFSQQPWCLGAPSPFLSLGWGSLKEKSTSVGDDDDTISVGNGQYSGAPSVASIYPENHFTLTSNN